MHLRRLRANLPYYKPQSRNSYGNIFHHKSCLCNLTKDLWRFNDQRKTLLIRLRETNYFQIVDFQIPSLSMLRESNDHRIASWKTSNKILTGNELFQENGIRPIQNNPNNEEEGPGNTEVGDAYFEDVAALGEEGNTHS
jgi:hypothetical protein